MGIYSDEPNAVISGHDFGGNIAQQEALAAARQARTEAEALRAAGREATTEGDVNTGISREMHAVNHGIVVTGPGAVIDQPDMEAGQ